MSILLLASLVVAGSASQDITNIPGILSDTVKAATTLPTVSDFEKSYQQFAELLAPVMLLSNGMNFEVRCHLPPVCECMHVQVSTAWGCWGVLATTVNSHTTT